MTSLFNCLPLPLPKYVEALQDQLADLEGGAGLSGNLPTATLAQYKQAVRRVSDMLRPPSGPAFCRRVSAQDRLLSSSKASTSRTAGDPVDRITFIMIHEIIIAWGVNDVYAAAALSVLLSGNE